MRNKQISAGFLRAPLVGALVVLVALAGLRTAHAQPLEAVRNVVQLSAAGMVEAEQDWLQMQLLAVHEGVDAISVQNQLRAAVDDAMRVLRPQAQGQNMQVRTGSFGVYPRNDSSGKIKGWQGRAEIVLEGRDFALISQAASNAPGMAIGSMGFRLSKEGQEKVQDQAQVQAIENFKNRAAQLAKQFGFTAYTLREVSVSYQDGHYAPRMLRANAAMASMGKMDAVESVPVEPGKTQVRVDVSGAVQMQ